MWDVAAARSLQQCFLQNTIRWKKQTQLRFLMNRNGRHVLLCLGHIAHHRAQGSPSATYPRSPVSHSIHHSMGCNWSSQTFAQQMSLAATNQKAIVLSWWHCGTKITANARNHRKRLFIVLKLVSCDLQGFVTFCYTATFICLYLPKKGTVAKVHVMHLESCPVRRSKEEKGITTKQRGCFPSHIISVQIPHTIQMYIVLSNL